MFTSISYQVVGFASKHYDIFLMFSAILRKLRKVEDFSIEFWETLLRAAMQSEQTFNQLYGDIDYEIAPALLSWSCNTDFRLLVPYFFLIKN